MGVFSFSIMVERGYLWKRRKKSLIEMLEEAFAGIPNVRIGSGEGKIIHIPNKKINESYKQKKKFIETK